MAKKKKNLRKKKSNNLLKGAVTAGAVVGGGAIFQGNNVVYAAEMNSDSISDSGSTDIGTESMSASTTQSESVSIPTSTEESDTNFPAGIHMDGYLVFLFSIAFGIGYVPTYGRCSFCQRNQSCSHSNFCL